ncbi:hypothetical protein [Terricaulis sp.]|uniref:hypothetical protein n=1 Tax=Terricaulis sp. TaxID=2768686 RepID=UPI002AC59B5F|nr:hypothetical protein [Terricaulis sp.]MDZ4690265.1 hypothetical protein [Terricaulis sp.]
MLGLIWKTASVLGLLASALSLASLIIQGFQLGLSAPIGAMLAYYEGLLHALLGWAEPILLRLADFASAWLGIEIRLSPAWKHVFVLVWLYFSVDARSSFLQQRPITASATLVVGLGVSVASVGAVSWANGSDLASVVFATAFPILGFVIHAIIESVLTTAFYRFPGRSVVQSLRYYLMTEVLSALLAGGVAIAVALMAWRMGAPLAALIALGAFILVRGAYWLLRGVYIEIAECSEGESWRQRFMCSGAGQFGALIFSVVLGALLFVAFNAGLTA